MREGWKAVQIEDVAKVANGGTPKTKVPEYWGGEHVWITPAEMGRLESPYLASSRRKLSDSGLQHSSATLVPSHSVILSTRAPIGHLIINSVPMAFNQGCRGIVPGENVHHKYLYYFLRFSEDLLNDLGSGTTFKELSAGKLKKVEIPLPPLPEQKGIVAILDEAFAGIDTAIANTQKNLVNAREVFKSYLDSVFSDAVMQWEEFPIEKHIKFIDYRGKTPKKTSSGLRLITAKNVRMGYLQREPEEFVDPETYDTWMTRGIPKKWDVLFTTEAPLGFACQLDTDEKVVFAQRIITMQPDRDIIHPDYLMFALRSSPIQSRIHEKATGATATGIKASLLKKIAIPVPEIIQQKVIAENAGSLEQESKRLEGIYEEKLTALAELKQSLLQKAFSGELTADAVEEVDTIEAALA
jgi:type I restriction enzyme S subunit